MPATGGEGGVMAKILNSDLKLHVYIQLIQLRIMNIRKRVEAVDQEIKKIRALKEKVVKDMAPVMPATGGEGGVMARANAKKLA